MKAGDKVVCVDGTPIPTNPNKTIADYELPDGMPEEGEVYEVESVPDMGRPHGVGVRIRGVRVYFCGRPWAFDQRRFRVINDLDVSTVAHSFDDLPAEKSLASSRKSASAGCRGQVLLTCPPFGRDQPLGPFADACCESLDAAFAPASNCICAGALTDFSLLS